VTTPRILSVGIDKILMTSRTLLLRNAGYTVQEAYTVDRAINLAEEDLIDIVLICHTVAQRDKHAMISAVREKRRLIPILYVRSYAYESAPHTCIAVDNDPEALLKTLKLASAPTTRV
jgi:CheY-like chemotaxis protein